MLQWIKDRFNNPAILVTENGFSDTAGNLDDLQRVGSL
jgi:lactase-phlorizin hydrolase